MLLSANQIEFEMINGQEIRLIKSFANFVDQFVYLKTIQTT